MSFLLRTIKVKQVSNYGGLLFYPVCESAKLFAELLGTKTLPEWALRKIKTLGYNIDVEMEGKAQF